MKKLIATALLCVFAAGAACAADEQAGTDDDYRNLRQLKRKLVRMKHEMDSFLGDLLATYPDAGMGVPEGFGADVRIDLAETDNDVVVKADLPGMDKDEINITIDRGRILTISGSRDTQKEESAPGMVRRERTEGSFRRVLELPAECVSEGIRASYNNGVLEMIIPKKEESKEDAVKIAVQ